MKNEKNGKFKSLLCIQSQFCFVYKAKKACSTSRSWGSNLALLQSQILLLFFYKNNNKKYKNNKLINEKNKHNK